MVISKNYLQIYFSPKISKKGTRERIRVKDDNSFSESLSTIEEVAMKIIENNK